MPCERGKGVVAIQINLMLRATRSDAWYRDCSWWFPKNTILIAVTRLPDSLVVAEVERRL